MCRITQQTEEAPSSGQDWAGAQVRRRRGLLTTTSIAAHTKVTSYSGCIKDPRPSPSDHPNIDISYFRSINGGQASRVIDGFKEPHRGFGMAQFANDPQGDDKNPTNPRPNCKFEVEEKEGKVPQVYLVTIRDVEAGLVLTSYLLPSLNSVWMHVE